MKPIQLILLGGFLLTTCSALTAQNRIAFATSGTGTGDLSSWPEAGVGLEGLEAADSICVHFATTAGLPNPGNFVAWLSDTNNDAYCRVQDLSGKKAANCNKGELPVDAGPWFRTDGVPVAAGLNGAIDGNLAIYNSMLKAESGQQLSITEAAWTSSSRAGTYNSTNNCEDWTNTSDNGRYAPLASSGWHTYNSASCGIDTRHLICVEKFAGPALLIPGLQGNIAFVTDVVGGAILGDWPEADIGTSGIEAGDSICNNLAEASDLPWQGTYKAWLSDSSTNARDRFVGDGQWYRLDGIKVLENISNLASNSLQAPISFTDQGRYLDYNLVWTGTNANGTKYSDRCSDWTATSGQTRAGGALYPNSNWSNQSPANCVSSNYRLYCLSDAVFDLFEDGFESE